MGHGPVRLSGSTAGESRRFLVVMRHGESAWNVENRFTGWTDVDLSPAGRAEAQAAGRLLARSGLSFDLAFSSVLRRAVETLNLVLAELSGIAGGQPEIRRSYCLNERHYGALQGHHKTEILKHFDPAHVHQWRRGTFARPPVLTELDERFPGNDPLYAGIHPSRLPRGESIRDTQRRVLPYWRSEVVPAVATGKRVLIVTHGHTIRALLRDMHTLREDEFTELKIPTARPLVILFDDSMRPVQRHYLESEVSDAG